MAEQIINIGDFRGFIEKKENKN